MKIKTILFTIIAAFALTACDDFLDITPTGKVIAQTGDEYRALLTYEYDNFVKDRYKTTLRTDELPNDVQKYWSQGNTESYLDLWRWNDENPASTTSYFEWRGYYHALYIANYIIEHQSEITKATEEEIDQLVGESYMMRAYTHFLLVNLYAEPYTHCNPATTRGVPLQLKADVNAVLRCSSVEDVYNSVLADIDEAATYLNVEKWETGYNYRFNKASAQALRARVLLYMGEWQGALDAAKAVLVTYNQIEDLIPSSPTLPNSYKSVESIVSLESFDTNVPTAVSVVSEDFLGMYRTGDQRGGSAKKFYKKEAKPLPARYVVQKGGSNADCFSSFRTAEIYLTAAEAAARLGNVNDAIEYLVPIMEKRLNKSAYTTTMELMEAMTQDELVQEILDERARELAFEGHRWYDLRRTTRPALTRTYNGETFTLTPEKYTMRFPGEAVAANPGIEIWDK